MPIRWDQSLAVGIPEIDEQHQELFARIDRLLDAMRTGDSVEVVRLFEFLGEYVTGHFSMEEEWMKHSHYPGYLLHKSAHDRFVKDFIELREQFQRKGAIAAVTIKVNAWLGEWLKAHISGTDKGLARHLLDQRRARVRI